MKKHIILTKRGLRKGIGQSISFVLVIIITAIMLNLALITMLNYNQSFTDIFDELQSPDISIATMGQGSAKFEQAIKDDDRVAESERTPALMFNGEITYNNNKTSSVFAFFDYSVERKLGQSKVTEQLSDLEIENRTNKDQLPIYISKLFQSGSGYQTGDTFTIKTDSKTYTFFIAGFTENIYLGTINTLFSGVELAHKDYQTLAAELGESAKGYWYKMKLHDSSKAALVESDYSSRFSGDYQRAVHAADRFYIQHFRTLVANIIASILLTFSLIILIVGLVVVRFRIQNNIEDDLQTIGALKALGYTGRQIMFSYVLQFSLPGGAAMLVGLGFSYLLLPALSEAFSSQTGLTWIQGFDPVSAGLTILALLSAICFTAWASSRRAGKIEPITALRSGSATHSFKRNPLPLKRHPNCLNLVLALKDMFLRTRQNILIIIIIAAVAFAGHFAVAMYYNTNVDPEKFIDMVGGEYPAISLAPKDIKQVDEMIRYTETLSGVRGSVVYETKRAQIFEINGFMDVSGDFSKINNRGLIEGRSPRYENEIALCPQLLEGKNLGIGDSVTLTYEDQSADYIITGYIQSSNQMGRDIQLTLEGARRMDPDLKLNRIYVYTDEGADVAALLETINKKYPEAFHKAENVENIVINNAAQYLDMVAIVAFLIIVITLGVIGLVLYLVIKTVINRNKINIGIQKALGYTSGQIILQTALKYLPVISFGAIVGSIFGALGLNPLVTKLFQGMGIVQSTLYVFPWMAVLVSLLFTLFAFPVALLVSGRIRKITPIELFM